MPEEDFHLSSQVHFQAHMPSLRDSTLPFTDPALPCRALTVPSPSTSLRASSAGLVAVLLLNCVMEEQLSSSRAACVIWPIAKS